MELVDQIVNGAVVAAVGFLVWWSTRGQIIALRNDMESRFEQVDQRFEQVDRRFDQVERRFGELSRELSGVRSDLTRVALAVGAQPPTERGA